MAIQKRKAVVKSAQDALANVRGKGTKRSAEEAAAAEDEAEETEQPDAEMAEEPEEEISEEDRIAQQEKEIVAARTKELKATAAGDLKELVLSKGLEVGKKEDNVAAILAAEAKARVDTRAQKARERAVVVKKKEELEALPFPELSERCRMAGILGKLTKQDRITQLIAKWQQDDGISKGLAAMAQEERHAELAAMDNAGLKVLCDASAVDPLLKEVMVDRLLKQESASGRFARPEMPMEEEKDAVAKEAKGSLVDAVLANENSRKKQMELKRKQEEAEANKKKDLQAKPIDELKKMLTSRGQEVSGKKAELVDSLMVVLAQEQAMAERKAKLRALSPDELKKLLAERKVEVTKGQKKDGMIEALFAQETKVRKELEAYQARAAEVEAKKKEELQARSAAELKETCATKGLKLGVAKDDRIATLIEAARADGEVDKLVAGAVRDARKEELLGMDKAALKGLCDQAGVDAIVKDVVVERLLGHESEHGRITIASEAIKRAAKKARTSKK